jgi:hypothetical protein
MKGCSAARTTCGPSYRLSLRFSYHQETLTRKPLYFMLSVLIPILTSETPVFVITTQLAHRS